MPNNYTLWDYLSDRFAESLWDGYQKFLRMIGAVAQPPPHVTGSVLTWEVGDPTPDFGAVAYRLQSRWTRPARRTTVFVAGRRIPALLGGVRGGIKNIFQVSHHLILARVFFSYLRTRP